MDKTNESDVIQSFSWTVYNNSLAVKKIDKTSLSYNESPIPFDILWFFDADELISETDYKEIQLVIGNSKYYGKISCKLRRPGKPDLGMIYQITWDSSLKKYLEHAFNISPPGTAAISFRKTNVNNVYEYGFCSVYNDGKLVDIPINSSFQENLLNPAPLLRKSSAHLKEDSNPVSDTESSDDDAWSIINNTFALKKIDHNTIDYWRTALSPDVLDFFDIDPNSSCQIRDITIIHSDIKYNCIIRRLSHKIRSPGPLFVLKWNYSLHNVINRFFQSGLKTHIVLSKTDGKYTYNLDLIKNPSEFINSLQKPIQEAKVPQILTSPHTDSSTKVNLSSSEEHREKRIKQLFDKEETKVRKILQSHYQYGLNIDSFVELMRFKNSYCNDFAIEYHGDDEQLKAEIRRSGILFEGKIYAVPLETAENLHRIITNLENDNVGIIYYEKLYSKNANWLFDGMVMSAEMLKEILSQIYSTFRFGQNYFQLDNRKIAEKEAISNEIMRVWGNQQLKTEEELNDQLQYIPEDKIKSTLSSVNNFLWNSRFTYTRRDLFQITDDEITALRDAAYSLCSEKTSTTFDELPLDNIAAENFEISQYALYEMVFSYLADDFDRNNSVITFKGDTSGTKEAIVKYCKERDSCTVSELKEVVQQISGGAGNRAIHSMLDAAYSIMIRVTAEDFVSDAMVNFDRLAIDSALDKLIPNGLCGIKEITTFSLFPSCGFEWNLFVLESYCRRFSKKYCYVSSRANAVNVGAIVKVGNTTDYDQIMVQAVAHSSVELNEAAVFDYLIEAGFQSRKRYNKMDKLLISAKKLR